MGGELEAELEGGHWIVRLGELEASAIYLDYALALLLDTGADDAHRIATQLLEEALGASAQRR